MAKFQAGKSGNPAGRPKGFAGVAAKIMKETRDGAELVEFALQVLRNKKNGLGVRMEAMEWLANRSIGRALQTLDVNAGGELSVHIHPHAALLNQTHVERARRLAELRAKKAAQETTPAPATGAVKG